MRTFSSPRRRLAGALLLAAALAVTAGAARQTATRHVSIHFRPMVGGRPFACGTSYAGIGKGHATLTPSDFAMFVSDVRLVTSDGREVPVALDQDGVYQSQSLALLDFEDGTGPCSNGSAEMHTAITGTVPEGKYAGLRFVIGVPFDRNHLDPVSQPSPLSVTRMFWVWNAGHKFLRFDAKSATGRGWVLHLGSTGCTPSTTVTTVPTSCAQPNRVAVALAGFDPDADVVIADAAALFVGSGSVPDSDQVCMSSRKQPACAGPFAALGLPFKGSPAGTQTFLRAAAAADSARK